MAIGDKINIANQETLVDVKNSIGNDADTGGGTTTGTVKAKLNTILQNFLSYWTPTRAMKLDKLDSINTGVDTLLNSSGGEEPPAGFDGTFSRTAFELNDVVTASDGHVDRSYIVCKFVAPVSGVYHYSAKRHYSSSGEKAYICKVTTDPSHISYSTSSTSPVTYYNNKESTQMINNLYRKSIGEYLSYYNNIYSYSSTEISNILHGWNVLISSLYYTGSLASSVTSFSHHFYAEKGELVMFVSIPYDDTSKQKIYNQKVTY